MRRGRDVTDASGSRIGPPRRSCSWPLPSRPDLIARRHDVPATCARRRLEIQARSSITMSVRTIRCLISNQRVSWARYSFRQSAATSTWPLSAASSHLVAHDVNQYAFLQRILVNRRGQLIGKVEGSGAS